MQCSERKDLLSLYALGFLEGDEREELRRHLQTGCPTCLGGLAEAHAVLAIIQSAAGRPAPSNARARLLARAKEVSDSSALILAERPRTVPNKFRTSHGPGMRIMSGFVGAAMAASVAAIAMIGIRTEFRKSLDNYKALASRQQQELIALQEKLTTIHPPSRKIDWHGLQFAMLKGQGAQGGAGGMLLWDAADKSYCFCAENLRNLPEGRTYELWLINADQTKFAGGTFEVDSHGSAKFKNTLFAAIPGPVVATAVTDEPRGGKTQPTGTVQLLGDVN